MRVVKKTAVRCRDKRSLDVEIWDDEEAVLDVYNKRTLICSFALTRTGRASLARSLSTAPVGAQLNRDELELIRDALKSFPVSGPDVVHKCGVFAKIESLLATGGNK